MPKIGSFALRPNAQKILVRGVSCRAGFCAASEKVIVHLARENTSSFFLQVYHQRN